MVAYFGSSSFLVAIYLDYSKVIKIKILSLNNVPVYG